MRLFISLKKNGLLLAFIFALSGLTAQEGWQTVDAINNPNPRHENAFVKVGEKFYLLGGRGIKPIGIYDPASRKWSEGAPMPLPISHFQAISYHGLIYVMGALVGDWPSETPLTHIFIYNPLTDSWLVGPEIPPHRQRGAAGTVVYKDKMYLVCGIVNGHSSGWVPWLDEYDPATNRWTELPDAPRSRDHLQAAVVQDQLVVTGGRKSGYLDQGFEATIAETDIFSFETNSWKTLPSPAGDIPTQRAGCTAITAGNEVIVIGGESGSQVPAHSEVEALNISSGQWRSLPPLQRGRHGTQVVMSDGKLYIAAGCGNRGGSPELDSFESMGLEGLEQQPVTVLEAGVPELSSVFHDFGKTRPYATVATTLEIRNIKGNQGIAIVYMVPAPTTEFKVDFPYDLPYVLAPGKSVPFKLYYTPTSGQPDEGNLLIKFMDKGI